MLPLLFKLKQKLFPLDPLSVSAKDAAAFFRTQQHANSKLLQMIAPVVETATTLFDVGANCGFFTKHLLDAYPRFSGRVVLFEPILNLIGIAQLLLADHKNLSFENTALGEHDGEIELYLPADGNIGWITAVHSRATGKLAYTARVSATGRFIAQYKPDLIKIDVEGYELFVLRPILPYIDHLYKPTFVVEVGWGKANPNWAGFLLVAAELARLGYRFRDAEGHVYAVVDLRNLERTTDLLIEPR